MCSRKGPDPDQAGPVHAGGTRPARGAVDTGARPALSAGLLRGRAAGRLREATGGRHLRSKHTGAGPAGW